MVEYLDIVDDDDVSIGKASREECHKRRLLHRSVYIFLFNKDRKLLLQKRSMSKDLYPGYYTASASGHVNYGESYEEAAQRELQEELGIKAPLIFLGKFRTVCEEENEISALYLCFFNGDLKVNRDEITDVKFEGLEEIREDITLKRKRFAPGFIEAFNFFEKKLEKYGNGLYRMGLNEE